MQHIEVNRICFNVPIMQYIKSQRIIFVYFPIINQTYDSKVAIKDIMRVIMNG